MCVTLIESVDLTMLTANYTDCGMTVNSTRNNWVATIPNMKMRDASTATYQITKSSVRDILSENVAAIMDRRYGKKNINRFAREMGIGLGTASRMLADSPGSKDKTVRLESLEKVANKIKCEVWQLLVPNLNLDDPPSLATSQLSKEQAEEVKKLRRQLTDLSPAQRDLFINSDEVKNLMAMPAYPEDKMNRREWTAPKTKKAE